MKTGTKRRRLKSLSAATRDGKWATVDDVDENANGLQSWSDLPAELLELILSRLNLKENVCVSAVCKRWNSIAVSVRSVNQPPWIMYFPKMGNVYEFYNPLTRKTHYVELPELLGSRVCYTKDGWLLLSKPATRRLFFFNPFSREAIELPRFEVGAQIFAFSCDPTLPNCIIFTVMHISPVIVAISTCRPGATQWNTINYQNRLPFVSSIWNKFVFSNGHFYCLSLTGWIGVYDPMEYTWNVLVIPPPACPENYCAKNWWKGKFLVEHAGDILVMYTCYNAYPIVFKLDRENMVWEEVTSLDGMTLFASFLSSQSRTDLPGIMRNSIYFSKVRFYGKTCISYSLKEQRYKPCKQFYDWGEQDPFESIWIDPPQDLSVFKRLNHL